MGTSPVWRSAPQKVVTCVAERAVKSRVQPGNSNCQCYFKNGQQWQVILHETIETRVRFPCFELKEHEKATSFPKIEINSKFR